MTDFVIIQLIELWETYLMQLDAEDDGSPFGAHAPPAGTVASPGPLADNARPETAESQETEAGTVETDA